MRWGCSSVVDSEYHIQGPVFNSNMTKPNKRTNNKQAYLEITGMQVFILCMSTELLNVAPDVVLQRCLTFAVLA